MTRKSLLQLFESHQGKVADKWQLYLEQYERLLAYYRDQPVRVLEVGVQNGGSLEIWAKYFPQAQIIAGCDIDPACAELSFDDPRITVIVGDVNSGETQAEISALSSEFDIIIDDGSHRSGDIIRSFGLLFPQLALGGSYIIEDLHCSYWEVYEGGLYHPFSSIAFLKSLADILNRNHWGLDINSDSIFDGFKAVYAAEFDEESLKLIHSVEFTDSVCTIRKFARDKNILGERILSGQDASVISTEELGSLTDEKSIVPSQKGNQWANGTYPPTGELMLKIHESHEQKQWIAKLLADSPEQGERIGESVPAILSQTISREDAFIRSTQTLLELLKTDNSKSIEWLRRDKPHDIDQNDYSEWVRRYDTLRDTDRIRIQHSMDNLAHKPLLSILICAHDPEIVWLEQAIASVQSQRYDNWELCIAADTSTDEPVREYLAAVSAGNARIKICFHRLNGEYSTAANSALEISTGRWIAILDQKDILPEHALFTVAKTIDNHPEACLIYSDEDRIDRYGTRSEPFFKCDWNRDLFYSHDLLSRLCVFRRSILDEIDGFREGFPGAEDYDLALRFIERIDSRTIHHIPRVLYHNRNQPNTSAAGVVMKPGATAAKQRALQEHLLRTGVKAIVDSTPIGNRVRYALPETPPLVSLIIPTKNRLRLLKTCLESIETKTEYPNFEILVVDNGSDDPAAIDYIAGLKSNARIRVLHDVRPFNYAELNNAAVEEAQGELICLLNNDTEVIEKHWLTEMVSIALQPGVGFVGSKLLYPDGTIQHAGVILGIRGVAAHIFKRAPGDSPGYFNRAKHAGSFSALTGACLVIKKEVFLESGGLDPENLAIAFNDIDLCLRVRELGYRNVFTPHALLYHHESASRGLEDTPEKKARFAREVKFMKDRWGNKLLQDPAYNPNLTLDRQDFSLAWPPRISQQYLP